MSLFLDKRFFVVLGALVAAFLVGYFVPPVTAVAKAGVAGLVALLMIDLALLRGRDRISAARTMADRLSNGDENQIVVALRSGYAFPVSVTILDELPPQLQIRDLRFDVTVPAGGEHRVTYSVRPVTRGEYHFGMINLFVASPLRLVRRRFRQEGERVATVYPSYLQMRRYELLAISNRLVEAGVKKIRRIGQTMEFDQIREYVSGDDYRTINWKATARRAGLMVNQFQDEKSQQIYSVIDTGRAMKMPFQRMTLLDYAINASLVLSNIAIHRQDKAGLITFSNTLGAVLPADRRRVQMTRIIELLYNQATDFLETDYALLYAAVRRRISSRSLILLFTNFETLTSMQRQLPYLRGIARSHRLVVVFFENTELRGLLERPASTTEEIYTKAIAEKFALEKKQIVKELSLHGIHSILTPPENLTVDTINKYLELKARRLI